MGKATGDSHLREKGAIMERRPSNDDQLDRPSPGHSTQPTLVGSTHDEKQPAFRGNDVPWSRRSFTRQWLPFRGMWKDVQRRTPYYISDWTLAFAPRNFYRVATTALKMFFINLMPVRSPGRVLAVRGT